MPERMKHALGHSSAAAPWKTDVGWRWNKFEIFKEEKRTTNDYDVRLKQDIAMTNFVTFFDFS